MYTNQQLADIYRRIDNRLHISYGSGAKREVVQAIGNLGVNLATYFQEHKDLSELKLPISPKRTKLNPIDVLEVIIAKGEKEATDYALEQLQRAEDYVTARFERAPGDHLGYISKFRYNKIPNIPDSDSTE